MKKLSKILIGIFVFAILVFIGGFFYLRHLVIEEKLKYGDLIEYKGKIYTPEEYNKMFPQVIDVPAKNTPLEAYEKFRKAVLAGDIDEAKKYLTEKSLKKDLKDLQDPKMLKMIQGYLPEPSRLKERSTRGNFSSWYYYTPNMNKEEDVPYSVDFEKDEHGYWKIDFF